MRNFVILNLKYNSIRISKGMTMPCIIRVIGREERHLKKIFDKRMKKNIERETERFYLW